MIDSNRANRDLLAGLLVVGVLLIGVVNWVLNWARRILTVQLLAMSCWPCAPMPSAP